MKIGLFIPCFIDQLYPQAGLATLELLEKQGMEVVYPEKQTCCGQPMANTGCEKDVRKLARKFLRLFRGFDYVVSPSASCVVMVKEQYPQYVGDDPAFAHLQSHIYEICEFLHDVLKIDHLASSFPYKVGLHNSCHGHRLLGLASPSELGIPYFSKLENLLGLVQGIELVSLGRPDECCGFGGTFSINEPDVSVAMGLDRLQDHLDAGAEFITGADYSCFIHLDGIIRQNKYPAKLIHIAEILNGGTL